MKKYLFFLTLAIALAIIFNNLYAQETKEENNKNTALIIIDIQNFYFPNGALPLFEPEKAAENAQKLLSLCRQNNITIIHVRHNAKSGAEIHELVAPIAGEKVISKDKANSFIGTDLLDYLNENKITSVVICGMQTHMCVEATTRAASDYGYKCTVIEDACTTRDLKFEDTIVKAKDVHYATLSTLNGTYANIISTTEFIQGFK